MPDKLLPAALIAAKREFGPALKSKVNPHFKSKYVDLADVIEVTEEPLAKQGLIVLQPTEVDEQGRIYLLTKLLHVSGEEVVGRYLLSPAKQDPQGYGAAMTYARRYCLMAILGIAPEDDDGNTASRAPRAQPAAAAQSPPAAPTKAPTKTAANAPAPASKKDASEILSQADRQQLLGFLAKQQVTWVDASAWLHDRDPAWPADGKPADLDYGRARLLYKSLQQPATNGARA